MGWLFKFMMCQPLRCRSTWFIIDGPDDTCTMRLLDRQGGLNRQVQQLQTTGEFIGEVVHFECFLTGDGKGMRSGNFQKG